MSVAGGTVLVGEVLVSEFDGSGVVAAVAAELAADGLVELVDVDAIEPAVAGDAPLEFEGHLLHVPGRASAHTAPTPSPLTAVLDMPRPYLWSKLVSVDTVDAKLSAG